MDDMKLVRFALTESLAGEDRGAVLYEGDESVATGNLIVSESGQVRRVTHFGYDVEGGDTDNLIRVLAGMEKLPRFVEVYRKW